MRRILSSADVAGVPVEVAPSPSEMVDAIRGAMFRNFISLDRAIEIVCEYFSVSERAALVMLEMGL